MKFASNAGYEMFNMLLKAAQAGEKLNTFHVCQYGPQQVRFPVLGVFIYTSFGQEGANHLID
eukprot:4807013-Amphidinium_carterae.1